MNKCIFMGRLVRDPEIRYTQSDQPVMVARYTLAVDRKFKRKGEPTADFLTFVSYGKIAEFVEKYLKQGIKITVIARCQTRSYEKDGVKKYVTEFVAEEHEFAESKKADKEAEPETDENGFMNIPEGIDEEIPFE